MSYWKVNVFATHEEAQNLAWGRPWPGGMFMGVALPSVLAKDRWVILRYGSLWTCAVCWDVGPFCHDDDSYVFGTQRPRAERLKGHHCPVTLADASLKASVPDGHGGFKDVEVSNGAGIDLFPGTAHALGIPLNTNVFVDWKFVEL